MTALLVLDGVSVRLGHRAVLQQVSHAIPPGRLTVIVGPNGAGKSTLVRVLSGELPPAAGAALWKGVPIAALSAARLAGLRAVVPQAAVLAFPFKVHEVVALGASVPGFGLAGHRRSIERAMAEADIAHLAARTYTELSGGERQRVQFARALCQLFAAQTPEAETALFLDEPTSSLDLPHQSLLMQRAAAQARAGRTVVAVLHDLNLAAAWGEHVMAISGGRLAAHGSPREVLTAATLGSLYNARIDVATMPGSGLPVVLPNAGPAPT
ncbi:MAG: heme ABC transporter ATP-binding protein [Hyphomicrobiaceae bacterium]|nr:heme ABC transporter ATP-binding protein [Hyphomicrobiaceae bacterium]